jgi:hypothetical protein
MRKADSPASVDIGHSGILNQHHHEVIFISVQAGPDSTGLNLNRQGLVKGSIRGYML